MVGLGDPVPVAPNGHKVEQGVRAADVSVVNYGANPNTPVTARAPGRRERAICLCSKPAPALGPWGPVAASFFALQELPDHRFVRTWISTD